MNEAETRAELIDPKLKENGWDGKTNPDVKGSTVGKMSSFRVSTFKNRSFPRF